MTKRNALKAIVVAHSADKAKQIAQTVNRSNYALKGKIAVSLNDLSVALTSKCWDTVLISDELPAKLSLDEVIQEIKNLAPNTPSFLISKETNEDIRTHAMQSGLCDAISIGAPKLLALILAREIPDAIAISTTEKAPLIVAPQKNNPPKTSCKVDLSHLSSEDKQWSERIKSALDEDRFLIVFQPIVNLNAEPAANYEILLRMRDEKGDKISPGIFLASAKKACLMASIDRWVIKHSVIKLLKQQQKEPNSRFFIKLSAQSLLDENLLPWVDELLRANKVPEKSLVFEITEANSLKYEQQAQTFIQSLKQIKCQIAIDHVGADNSQSEQWLQLAPDYIKLSGQLMSNLKNNEEDQETVTRISNYANSRKILTIAQFVQDPTALAFLWQRGINYIQGYYLQRPDTSLNYDFNQE